MDAIIPSASGNTSVPTHVGNERGGSSIAAGVMSRSRWFPKWE
jgi:hypothetical protein